jgi:hypothetical protein
MRTRTRLSGLSQSVSEGQLWGSEPS